MTDNLFGLPPMTWGDALKASEKQKPITLEDFQKAWDDMRNAPPKPIRRIVSATVYAEAKKAEDAGATPRQIEMCLAGAKWEWVKDV